MLVGISDCSVVTVIDAVVVIPVGLVLVSLMVMKVRARVVCVVLVLEILKFFVVVG